MSKYGGMKKAEDWAGKSVRLTREVANGMGVVPTCTPGKLSGGIKAGHIHFTADPCNHCGAQFRVSGLTYGDFELIEPAEYTGRP